MCNSGSGIIAIKGCHYTFLNTPRAGRPPPCQPFVDGCHAQSATLPPCMFFVTLKGVGGFASRWVQSQIIIGEVCRLVFWNSPFCYAGSCCVTLMGRVRGGAHQHSRSHFWINKSIHNCSHLTLCRKTPRHTVFVHTWALNCHYHRNHKRNFLFRAQNSPVDIEIQPTFLASWVVIEFLNHASIVGRSAQGLHPVALWNVERLTKVV